MRHFSLFFGVLMVGLLSGAQPALADVPPEGACSQVGEVCDHPVDESGRVAGTGMCRVEQCTRGTPDGPMTYECRMCRPEPAEPGVGGAASDPAQPTAGTGEEPAKPSAGTSNDPVQPSAGKSGGSSAAGAPSKPAEKPETDDAGGCSISLGSRGVGSTALASLLVLGLALVRRRSQQKAG